MQDSIEDAKKEIYTAIRNKTKEDFKEIVSRLTDCLKDDSGLKRIKENSDYILEDWTAAGLRLKNKEGIKGCSAEGHVSHILSSRMSSRPMDWSIKGMSKMAELRAYYYNGGDMLELVRYQKEILPKAAGCEEVIRSCGQLLAQEGKHKRDLEVLANMPVYSIPYPKVKKIANFKDHIYGL